MFFQKKLVLSVIFNQKDVFTHYARFIYFNLSEKNHVAHNLNFFQILKLIYYQLLIIFIDMCKLQQCLHSSANGVTFTV